MTSLLGQPPQHFYPRPPRGGRLVTTRPFSSSNPFLSPPSARRATFISPRPVCSSEFLSPPSARRATRRGRSLLRLWNHFYPRPPRGGRLTVAGNGPSVAQFLSPPSARRATGNLDAALVLHKISIPALREEGDLRFYFGGKAMSKFLSPPSARRATAKTETKSLFSNKLYNILHEFRRALIYNGSKNYPNHAK